MICRRAETRLTSVGSESFMEPGVVHSDPLIFRSHSNAVVADNVNSILNDLF